MQDAAAAAVPGDNQRTTQIIEPLVVSTVDVLKVSCNVVVRPGTPYLKGFGGEPPKECAAFFGVMGEKYSGLVTICLSEKMYLFFMEKMLGEKVEKVTPELMDGLTELVNMIFGKAKKMVNAQGDVVKRLIPTIISGKETNFKYLTSGKTVIVPFETEAGTFHLEITTEENTL